ncbi:hypothetical protein BRC90_02835 [Halobacteriales archaeon QS_4_69_34]|nr:MAG: hypothetical protein BRC90_02835 [Halobacteriales archaeon QS_4_69_34]
MAGRKRTVTDEEILNLIDSFDQPVVTARQVAEELEFSNQGANNRLRKLENEGEVESMKVGASAMVWWIP